MNQTHMSLNATEGSYRHSNVDDFIPVPLSVFMIGCAILLMLCGLLGDLLVITGFITSKEVRKPYNIIIFGLGLTDFVRITGVQSIKVYIYIVRKWSLSADTCLYLNIVYIHTSGVITCCLIAMAIYQYIMVLHPQLSKKVNRYSTVVAIVVLSHIAPFAILAVSKLRIRFWPKTGNWSSHVKFHEGTMTCVVGETKTTTVVGVLIWIIVTALVICSDEPDLFQNL